MKFNMTIRLIAVIIALFLLMVSLQVRVDVGRQELAKRYSRPFVPPRADLAREAALGYHTLLADAYWLRTIQYFAESCDLGVSPDELFPMTDFITDLDPDFCFAYYFTGLNLVINGGRPRDIRDILEKGKENCPRYWKIAFQLGFFYYYSVNRYDLAADNLELAYQLTGYRNIGLLATRVRSQGGQPETAIQLLQAMAESTDDPRAKSVYQERIAELQAQAVLNRLNEAVENFFSTEGRYPTDPSELVAHKLIPGIPGHPVAGHRFVYLETDHRFDNEPKIFTGVFDRRRK